MDTRLLIDGIVRQTTLLIAQLSTEAGIRAPLAHVADQVFLSLAQEIEAQGVGRKVVADMFGLALRTYQKKIHRLMASAGNSERTLWQAVLDTLIAEGSISRSRLLKSFARDGEKETLSVLNDLVSSGLAYTSGRGPSMLYGITSTADQQRMNEAQTGETLANMLWVAIYREPGVTVSELARRVTLDETAAMIAVEQLVRDGRVRRDGNESGGALFAETFTVPVGSEIGWESAVYDHFQAVTSAIASKLRQRGPRSSHKDLIGGATLSFDLYPGHPKEQAVYGLLAKVRSEIDGLWRDVRACNQARPVTDDERIKVTFYFGQNVDETSSAEEQSAALRERVQEPS
ncbi:MAG TPA: hypothetical protein VHM70_29765 [Polyangiaceae bacterium]|jgi:hypothetical protein|nr:hypothetical protein [Polyangiaceae bacterium]